ncbi:hypothetical protein [Amycolatopsis sp. NPDC001319]|uniref:hypothetical protein n=1 Tax=unclassified Amycolatopsis TaxID=2618356 RepID=UPI0036B51645
MTENTNHHPPDRTEAGEPADRDLDRVETTEPGEFDLSGIDVSDVDPADLDTLVVDCDRCAVRGHACHDCVVSVLLGPPVALAWDADERRAVNALAEAGMVPRLRLVSEPERKPA